MKTRVIIFIGVMLAVFLPHCKKEINKPGYAIGQVNYYAPGSKGKWSEINYTFYVNGTEIDNHYTNRAGGKKWKVPHDLNCKNGDRFVVQYNLENPGDNKFSNRMLFAYPVKDSIDFKSYLEEFTTDPPE
jgi:hypothetical protein